MAIEKSITLFAILLAELLRTHWATLTNFKDSERTSYPDVADLSWHEQRVLAGPSKKYLAHGTTYGD
jgi:hypothetical protein